jgi:hypothetical protein
MTVTARDVSTVILRTPIAPRWRTDRRADANNTWLDHFLGWGVDDVEDLVSLRAQLKREPPSPFWMPAWIGPRPAAPTKTGYYETPRQHLSPALQRSMAAAEARRRTFVNLISAGKTVREACDVVGVSTSTYTQWRSRYEDFRLEVERIHAGLAPTDSVDHDFVSRRRYYFGYDTFTHHKRMVDAIEDTPDGGITFIIVAPEAGKTTLVQDWVCDKVAEEPNTRILYISETADGQSPAVKVLGAVKSRMSDVDYEDPDTQYPTHIPEWHAKYGPFHDEALDRDRPWNARYCKVHKAATGRKDYTFQTGGWRSKIYGTRCDWLIFDDVQSAEGIGDTDRIIDRCRKTFFNRPGRKGHIVFIGTRVGVGDVYERLVEELPERMIRVVQIPALDEEGNSYCPELWPNEALADKRAIVGEDGWLTAYMMTPQASGVNTFSEEMLDAIRDEGYAYGQHNPGLISLTIAGLDPALGGGNAIVCAQTTATQFRVLAAQVDYHLARNEDIYGIIRSMCRFRFTKLVVEKNSQQRGIARDDRLRDLGKIYGFAIEEHETGKNKWDFVLGVGAMAGDFIRGAIRFPDADVESRRRMEPLRGELLAWRPNVDPKLLRQDLVMALWFTWLAWTRSKKKLARGGQDTGWKRNGTPWRPGDMSGQWGVASMRATARPTAPYPARV